MVILCPSEKATSVYIIKRAYKEPMVVRASFSRSLHMGIRLDSRALQPSKNCWWCWKRFIGKKSDKDQGSFPFEYSVSSANDKSFNIMKQALHSGNIQRVMPDDHVYT